MSHLFCGWARGPPSLTIRPSRRLSQVVKKFDSRGIGALDRPDDNWLQVQDQYSDLLSRISQNEANAVDAKAEQPKTSYLQDRVASSKRMFYRRFVSNKDAASYRYVVVDVPLWWGLLALRVCFFACGAVLKTWP